MPFHKDAIITTPGEFAFFKYIICGHGYSGSFPADASGKTSNQTYFVISPSL
jgi:hypothetical protein